MVTSERAIILSSGREVALSKNLSAALYWEEVADWEYIWEPQLRLAKLWVWDESPSSMPKLGKRY
jgi:hypothetical protein